MSSHDPGRISLTEALPIGDRPLSTQVKGNNWKGVKVSQYWGGKVRVRSGWVFKQVASFFTGKVIQLARYRQNGAYVPPPAGNQEVACKYQGQCRRCTVMC